jgi:hypothetical protein
MEEKSMKLFAFLLSHFLHLISSSLKNNKIVIAIFSSRNALCVTCIAKA